MWDCDITLTSKLIKTDLCKCTSTILVKACLINKSNFICFICLTPNICHHFKPFSLQSCFASTLIESACMLWFWKMLVLPPCTSAGQAVIPMNSPVTPGSPKIAYISWSLIRGSSPIWCPCRGKEFWVTENSDSWVNYFILTDLHRWCFKH